MFYLSEHGKRTYDVSLLFETMLQQMYSLMVGLEETELSIL